jgi:hypothetical protein
MNTCPHCGGAALSFWKKMVLGPVFKVQCAQCRNLIGVAKGKAWLSLTPLLIGAWMPFMFHVHPIIPLITAMPLSSALFWLWDREARPDIRPGRRARPTADGPGASCLNWSGEPSISLRQIPLQWRYMP